MYLVVEEEPGIYALNYMWLPTWLGMNTKLIQEIEDDLKFALAGMTPEQATRAIISYLEKKFPTLPGLRDYLDGIKFVRDT